MKDDIRKSFKVEYEDITTPLMRNYELTIEEYKRIKEEIELIYKNLTSNNIVYTSDFKSIQTLLRDLQFYEYVNREEFDEKESETSK